MNNLQNIPNTPQQKFPTILLILLFSSASLLIGLFLGKYIFTSAPDSISAVPTPVVSTPSATPTVNPTANWKVYKNEKYGFEIKYEGNLSIEEINGEKDGVHYYFNVQFGKYNDSKKMIVEVVKKGEIDKEYYRWRIIGHISDKINSEEEFVFGTIKGLKFNYSIISEKENYTLAVIQGKNYNYAVTAKSGMVDQILSTFKFTEKENNLTPSPALIKAEISSTDGWKTVFQNGVSYKIPPDAKCNDERACNLLSYEWDYNGHKVPSSISINVSVYNGGSRREQFLEKNQEVQYCNPQYNEVSFGQIKGLQILTDGSICQGNSGGIAVVIGNKFISFGSGGDLYAVRNTVISTLK